MSNQRALTWECNELKLDLKYTWKISRNSSNFKLNTLIKVSDGIHTGVGEGAPNIRYSETPELMKEGFDIFIKAGGQHIQTIEDIYRIFDNTSGIPFALQFAITSAYTHLQAAQEKLKVYEYLHLQAPQPAATSFSLPIMDMADIKAFYDTYQLSRFRHLKIKINSETGMDMLQAVSNIANQPLIVDANEAWKDPDELMRFLEKLKSFRIAIIEQPMPSGFSDAYRYIKPISPYKLIADESLGHQTDLTELKNQFHGVNVKLMKSGSYQTGIQQLKEARRLGMQTMIGCMVETSLGISSALCLTSLTDFIDLDGHLIVSNEPFHLIDERGGMLQLKQ